MNFAHSLSAKLRRRRGTPQEVMLAIFLLLLASSYLRDHLAGASNSWWMRFGALPIYTYISGLLLPTILLINAYALLNDNSLLSPVTLLRNTRLTWRYMATAMFYQNLARQCYNLTIWALGAASAALPRWLWWLDAVAKPTMLVFQLHLLYLEMVWAVVLVLLALAIPSVVSQQFFTIPAWIWSEMSIWVASAEGIIKEDWATGFFLTCCFAGVRAVYHGAVEGLLPAWLRHLLTCVGTMFMTSAYTNFACVNLVKQDQNAALATELANQRLELEAALQPPPAVEVETQTYYRGFTVTTE